MVIHREWGWRGGSVAKSLGCSCRGPECGTQRSRSISQLPVTLPITLAPEWSCVSMQAQVSTQAHICTTLSKQTNTQTHTILSKNKQTNKKLYIWSGSRDNNQTRMQQCSPMVVCTVTMFLNQSWTPFWRCISETSSRLKIQPKVAK